MAISPASGSGDARTASIERAELGDRAAALLRLVADIDLDEAVGARGRLCRLPWPAPRPAKAGRANGSRRTGAPPPPPCSTGAGRSVKPKVGMAREQRRPFRLRLLHAVLAEVALAGGDQRLDRLGRVGLADGDQPDVGGIAPRQPRRLRRSGRGSVGDVLRDCSLPARYRKRHEAPPAICRAMADRLTGRGDGLWSDARQLAARDRDAGLARPVPDAVLRDGAPCGTDRGGSGDGPRSCRGAPLRVHNMRELRSGAAARGRRSSCSRRSMPTRSHPRLAAAAAHACWDAGAPWRIAGRSRSAAWTRGATRRSRRSGFIGWAGISAFRT